VQRESETRSQTQPLLENKNSAVDLEPELRPLSSTSGHLIWTALDLVVSVNAVKLHLYDALASSEIQLKEHGIARFALNDNTLRLKILSDGASEAQVVLRSFTMSNTRPGQSKFREIIPAAQHNRNQFMLLYSMTGGMQGSSLAILTVDSPQVIFAIEPVIYLLEFFTASSSTETDTSSIESPSTPGDPPSPGQAQVDFRVDLHDVSISVLEDDADPDSQAIRLYISQLLLSKQVQNYSIIQTLPHLHFI
jgi:vacuolar protein sorting-associated protein 13A/C